MEAKGTCALFLFLFATKKKAVIVSFREDTKILTADRTAGSPTVCKECGSGNLTNCGEVTCDGLVSRPAGVGILLPSSCYRNRDKLRELGASVSKTSFCCIVLISIAFADF